ncbi:transposase [Microcoleus sp.]|uniref:transposase n=2 Tax=Microcoleus sp. TaxID=44472 RepID=UPI003525E139
MLSPKTGIVFPERHKNTQKTRYHQVEMLIAKKLDRKIHRLEKKLARQQKDSKRRNASHLQIAKLHNEIADIRTDFLHKLSTKIVNENQVIVLEDFKVSGMVNNRKLARAINQLAMV